MTKGKLFGSQGTNTIVSKARDPRRVSTEEKLKEKKKMEIKSDKTRCKMAVFENRGSLDSNEKLNGSERRPSSMVSGNQNKSNWMVNTKPLTFAAQPSHLLGENHISRKPPKPISQTKNSTKRNFSQSRKPSDTMKKTIEQFSLWEQSTKYKRSESNSRNHGLESYSDFNFQAREEAKKSTMQVFYQKMPMSHQGGLQKIKTDETNYQKIKKMISKQNNQPQFILE